LGLFITFEGVEGCGKSTQTRLLLRRLEERGKSALMLREPGGTGLGEAIREILLGDAVRIEPLSELFLYEAARAELVSSVIRKALASNGIVLCDRFIDSTIAYQGFGRGLDTATIEKLNNVASSGIRPDLTILFDLDVEEGLKRALARINGAAASAGAGPIGDRLEREAIDFHERVRKGFLEIASKEPGRVKVVDATRTVENIHAEVWGLVEEFI
jgi:dTMP kinase